MGTSERVLAMLKEFCVNKGVEEGTHRHLRRPRTCLITATKVASVRHSDHTYLVSHRVGIRYVPKEMCDAFFDKSDADLLKARQISPVPSGISQHPKHVEKVIQRALMDME